MKADTRLFGQIEIEPEKIIEMEQGLIGFPDLKHFTLIYDSVFWCGDADLNLVSTDFKQRNLDIIVQNQRFAFFPGKRQHLYSPAFSIE